MKKLIFIVLLMCSSVHASESVGENSGVGNIKQLYVTSNGKVVRVIFSQPIKNPSGCQKAEGYIVELGDYAGGNRFLSTLLAAYTAKKDVSFYVKGCTSKSYWGGTWPTLYDIYMY